MKNLLIIIVVFSVLFFLYRSCTKGYDQYGYYVQVKNETLFKESLSDSDPDIISHGRKLISEILQIDQTSDNGNGSEIGYVRWYICSGIDCDERWQDSFKP